MSTITRRPHSDFVFSGDAQGAQLHGLSDGGAVATESEIRNRIQYLKETTATGSYQHFPTLRSRLQREIEKRTEQFEPGGTGLSHRLHRYYSQFGNNADAVLAEWESKGWIPSGHSQSSPSTGGGHPVMTAGGSGIPTWMLVAGLVAAGGTVYVLAKK